MTTLAIDPGKRAGWCSMSDGRVEASGVCDGDDVLLIDQIISEHLPCELVIEDQYFGRARNKSIKTLLRRRYTWEVLARVRRIGVTVVNPSTWQSFLHIKRGDKQSIMVFARQLRGRSVEADEADAVCMAYWREVTRDEAD